MKDTYVALLTTGRHFHRSNYRAGGTRCGLGMDGMDCTVHATKEWARRMQEYAYGSLWDGPAEFCPACRQTTPAVPAV